MSFFIGSAIAFGLFLGWKFGADIGVQFFSAGWLTEYSLSVDNLFVFVLIMARFYVPRHLQQYVLMWGIIIALVLRGIFIALGAAVIASFSWVFYIFGFFLILTAVRLATHGEDTDEEYKENVVVRFVARLVPVSQEFEGTKMRTVVAGRRVFTPMLVVLIAIGTTDLLFALDSIPAIFGLTQIPFIVFTANVFALMGLRQLYFLLGNPAGPVGLPGSRPGSGARFHRSQADSHRDAREHPEFPQRRRAVRRPGDFELDQPCGDRRHTDGHCGGKSVARALRGHRGRTG